MSDKARKAIAEILFDKQIRRVTNLPKIADAILAALPGIIADMVEPIDWTQKVVEELDDGLKLHVGAFSVRLWSGKPGARLEHLGQPIFVDCKANGLSLLVKEEADKHNVAQVLKALGMEEGE